MDRLVAGFYQGDGGFCCYLVDTMVDVSQEIVCQDLISHADNTTIYAKFNLKRNTSYPISNTSAGVR